MHCSSLHPAAGADPGKTSTRTALNHLAALAVYASLLLLTAGASTAQPQSYSPNVAPASGEAQAALKTFKVAPGLTVDLFAAEPDLANPVAFSIDEHGRFYVAETFRHSAVGAAYRLYEGVLDIRSHLDWLNEDLALRTVKQRVDMLTRRLGPAISKLEQESERIKLIEDRDGDGKADHSTVFAEGFNQIPDGIGAGLLAWKSNVWFTCIPDLWLLQDHDGDGRAEVRKSAHTGYGVHIAFLGHDLHGLRMGPDGRLYFSIGDRGIHVRNLEGQLLDFPDEGTILRCNPNGTGLEVFARGLRNPQELAFDVHGNLFTGDNNSDSGDRARWVHLVEGSDSGWRIGYQHIHAPISRGPWNAEKLWHPRWNGQAAYILPPIANLGYGPSGLTYNPGTGLPPRYDRHFFLCDFRGGASSGVHSFALKPRGASFEITGYSQFIWDVLATDVEFGVEGGLYLTDWVASWQKTGKGRIYRVHDPEIDASPEVRKTKTLLAANFNALSRLELKGYIAHPDQRVRQEAQFALVHKQARSTLTDIIYEQTNPLPRLHAIWGLGQLGRQQTADLLQLIPVLKDPDPEIRSQALKALGEARYERAFREIQRALRDPHPRVRFHAAMALAHLRNPGAVSALIKMLRQNNNEDLYLRHAGVMALARCASLRTLSRNAGDRSPAVRIAILLALRQLQSPEIALFLNDEDPALILEAARAINDVPITAAQDRLAALIHRLDLITAMDPPPAAEPVPARADATSAEGVSGALSEVRTDTTSTTPAEQLFQRVINASFRLGTDQNAAAIARLAATRQLPESLRALAIEVLAQWSNPPGRDLVVGLWRPIADRDPTQATAALQQQLPGILAQGSPLLQVTAITALESLKLTELAPATASLATNTSLPGHVRDRALQALAQLDYSETRAIVSRLLQDPDPVVRNRASRIQAGIDPAAAAAHLLSALKTGTVGEKQNALAAFGALQSPEADAVLTTWMDDLLAGRVAPSLQLDLLNAASQRSTEPLLARLKQYQDAAGTDNLAPFKAALHGGNAAHGERIFNENLELACIRCHKAGGEGGEAGPDLTGIGTRHNREYLLKSILFPNEEIAPGFASVIVTLNNGIEYAGKLLSEDETRIAIDSPEDGEVVVEKKEIRSRAQGLSAMPEEFRQILSRQDLRDLVEYLSTL